MQAHKDADYDVGDPAYLAPELLDQNKYHASFFAVSSVFTIRRLGPEADVFSAGMTLLELVSNSSVPSRGPAWAAIRQGSIPEELFAHSPPALTHLIRRMLAPNPRDRSVTE